MANARIEEGLAALRQNDFLTAKEQLEPLARLGSGQAQLGLGFIYDRGGEAVPRDYAIARQWYEKAWSQGSAVEAALALGRFYYLGLGVPVDYFRAFKYYSAFENTHSAVGLLRLGVMHEAGQGVERNLSLALTFYRRSAKNGNIHARKRLGVLLLRERKFVSGLFYWTWAIVQGVPLAFINADAKALRMF